MDEKELNELIELIKELNDEHTFCHIEVTQTEDKHCGKLIPGINPVVHKTKKNETKVTLRFS